MSTARELAAPRSPAKQGQESVNTSIPALQVRVQGGVCSLPALKGPSRLDLQLSAVVN